jgi:hypothetical protein
MVTGEVTMTYARARTVRKLSPGLRPHGGSTAAGVHPVVHGTGRGRQRPGALASYRRLLSEFERKKYDASRAIKMVDHANVAIKRLSS